MRLGAFSEASVKTRIYIILFTIMIGAAVGAIVYNETRAAPNGHALKMLTFNVGTFTARPPDIEKVHKIISDSGETDIALLQEVPGIITRFSVSYVSLS